MELRILFQRDGYCKVSLLPRRPQGSPEECTVSSKDGSVELISLEAEWYQDVVPKNFGALLKTGLMWTDDATNQQWQLAGRDIFVFAVGTVHRGFVTCPRLVLGREHVILCVTSRIGEVERILKDARSDSWVERAEKDGAPPGWTVLSGPDGAGRIRGLVTRVPVPHHGGGDILDVLKPLPEVEIILEDGVCLGHNSWMAGQPPVIRIYGVSEHTEKVLIDGQDAARLEQGYVAPGWDEPGTHEVWCGGATSKYTILDVDVRRSPWAAYSFPSLIHPDMHAGICGPLVRIFADGSPSLSHTFREPIDISPGNPVLIGSSPGEVFIASRRDDIRGAHSFVSPPFEPVWALPAQPLHCDKSWNRVLLIGRATAPGRFFATRPRTENLRSLERWWRYGS